MLFVPTTLQAPPQGRMDHSAVHGRVSFKTHVLSVAATESVNGSLALAGTEKVPPLEYGKAIHHTIPSVVGFALSRKTDPPYATA